MSVRTGPQGPAPRPLVVLGAMGATLILLPVLGLLVRTPWARLGELLSKPIVSDAVRLSLITSVAAAFISLCLGLPLAWLISRTRFWGRSLLRAFVTLPMVLPPVVGGAALLFALGRRGVIGEPLYELTGFSLPFSVWGVILANTFVAMPFLVLTIEAALNNTDHRQEAAAATLGASRLTVFRRVTVPMIRPSIAAGLVLAWARALGEFGATITFAGNLQGRTQTLPLAVFVSLEADRDAAIAISLILIVISIAVLLILRNRWWSAQ